MKRMRFLRPIALCSVFAVLSSGLNAASPAQKFLNSVMKAQGGLQNWQEISTVEFNLKNWPFGPAAPLNDHHVIELRSDWASVGGLQHRIVSNGQKVWVSPRVDVVGISPRLYLTLTKQIFTMPFLFAAAGVQQEAQGNRRFMGQEYEVVRFFLAPSTAQPMAVFDYTAYFTKNTHRLKLVHYAPGYPVNDPAIRHALIFDEWQTVDGLAVPRQVSFVEWQNLNPGARLGVIVFDNVRFRKEPYPASVFQPPADGFEDPVPASALMPLGDAR